MALTLTHYPDLIQPVYNPIIYRALSSIYSATGYKYTFKVYNSGTLVATLKTVPDPSGAGIADVSKILRDYIARIARPTTNTTNVTEQVIKYTVEISEEVQGGLITAVTNQASVVTLAIQDYTTNSLDGKKLSTLILPGLALSHAAPYWIKHSGTTYELYRDSALTLPVTATGAFGANGFVQTEDNAIIGASTKVMITTGENLAIDCVRDYISFLTWSGGAGYVLNGTADKFLTNAPTTKTITRDDYETIGLLQDYSANVDYVKVSAYTSAGVLIGSDNLNNTRAVSYNTGTYVWTDHANLKLEIGVGPKNLLLNNPSSVVDDATCAYYTIQAFDASNVAISELRTYTLAENCDKYEPMRLVWLNPHGSYDYYTFKLVQEKNLKVQRSTYRKNLAIHSYLQSDRGLDVYHLQAEKSFVIATDFVDTDTANWLQDLFMSPDVFMLDSAGKLTPVILTNESYSYKMKGVEKLKQYTIELASSHKNISNV